MSSIRHVVALHDCSTHHPETGLVVRLRKDQLWPATHPLVRARPNLFSEPTLVEQATSNPGEKRQVRRGPA
jgi:hypothetical protein